MCERYCKEIIPSQISIYSIVFYKWCCEICMCDGEAPVTFSYRCMPNHISSSPALPVCSIRLLITTECKHNTSCWIKQVCHKVCTWSLCHDLDQKWDIEMTVTCKWFPPITFPLLSPSIIISLISATLCRWRRGSCLHPSTDELHFKFITSGMKKSINKKERSFRTC